MENSELPHDVLGHHDTLRHGLPALKSDALPLHPVQSLHQEKLKFGADTKRKIVENLYGSAFALRMDFDRQILSRCQRPGNLIPSSMIGLESLTGTLDELNFENIIYDPRDSSRFVAVDMHDAMELRLGLNSRKM
ncbi:hypothetical protein SELMODRAFT_169783 [Selaginella moellendorffii]|uniref:Proteasome maturation factor UMP1 n=1 Tax=Selaginella moellendorffii TaxID=88036 RepID=D8RB13_SELML|nr:cyclin-B1-2 [Selaginella moellendorffii]EFJ30721.1 hypothetical protein SELMODRAFT_169783 [Selaginella moellendorffii]|eukprot:XP_002968467.1 cyclin-B1-2 [Selaginella moellendorffii]